MQGIQRKVVYIGLYELIAIPITGGGLAAASGQSFGLAGALGLASCVIAILWNLVFNGLFERWEARRGVAGRSVRLRMAHAVAFEGGLVAMLVPLFAWGLQVSLWHALVMDLGLILFFLVYTFVYNWSFDRVFGLPASASGAAAGVA